MVSRCNSRRRAVPFALVLVIGTAGCTTRLEVSQLDPGDHKPADGIIYYLPQGSLDITVTRRLIDCPKPEKGNKPTMVFEIKSEAKDRYGPDWERPMIIRYEDLNNFMKKTSLRASVNADGTLNGLKNERADRTAAVIGNIGKSVVNLAKTVIEAAAPGAAEVALQSACNEKTGKALKRRGEAKADLAARETGIAWLPREKQIDEQRRIDSLKAQLQKLDDFLVAKSTKSVTPDFATSPAAKPDLPRKCIGEAWHQVLKPGDDFAADWVESGPNSPSNIRDAQDATTVYLLLKPQLPRDVVAASARAFKGMSPGTKSSFFYRQPANVEASLKRLDPKDKSHIADSRCMPVGDTYSYALPQAGVLAYLPLVNHMFDSNVIEATFHPSGALASFDYLTESQAEAASGALVSMTDTSSQIATEAAGAEVMGLERRVKELEARKKLRELNAELDND